MGKNSMTKRQINEAAKNIVLDMLSGRCLPEDSDVEQTVKFLSQHLADDTETIEQLKAAVQRVLKRLEKVVGK